VKGKGVGKEAAKDSKDESKGKVAEYFLILIGLYWEMIRVVVRIQKIVKETARYFWVWE